MFFGQDLTPEIIKTNAMLSVQLYRGIIFPVIKKILLIK
jgi:hypothetical protein